MKGRKRAAPPVEKDVHDHRDAIIESALIHVPPEERDEWQPLLRCWAAHAIPVLSSILSKLDDRERLLIQILIEENSALRNRGEALADYFDRTQDWARKMRLLGPVDEEVDRLIRQWRDVEERPIPTIARLLNERGLTNSNRGEWTPDAVKAHCKRHGIKPGGTAAKEAEQTRMEKKLKRRHQL